MARTRTIDPERGPVTGRCVGMTGGRRPVCKRGAATLALVASSAAGELDPLGLPSRDCVLVIRPGDRSRNAPVPTAIQRACVAPGGPLGTLVGFGPAGAPMGGPDARVLR